MITSLLLLSLFLNVYYIWINVKSMEELDANYDLIENLMETVKDYELFADIVKAECRCNNQYSIKSVQD